MTDSIIWNLNICLFLFVSFEKPNRKKKNWILLNQELDTKSIKFDIIFVVVFVWYLDFITSQFRWNWIHIFVTRFWVNFTFSILSFLMFDKKWSSLICLNFEFIYQCIHFSSINRHFRWNLCVWPKDRRQNQTNPKKKKR